MSKREKLYNLLKETFILLDDGDRHLFSRFNLTPPRFYALLHISEEPGISASGLSNRLLCDKSNVTRIVKGLETDGYIVREPHETDGRSLRLLLTQEGNNIVNQVQTAHREFNEERLNCVSEAAQQSLLHCLTTVHQALHAMQSMYDDDQNPNV